MAKAHVKVVLHPDGTRYHVTKNGRGVSLPTALSALKKSFPEFDAKRWELLKGGNGRATVFMLRLLAVPKIVWMVSVRAHGVVGNESIVKGCTTEAGDPLRIQEASTAEHAAEIVRDWIKGTATATSYPKPGEKVVRHGMTCDDDGGDHFWPVGTYYIRVEPVEDRR